MYGLFKYLVWLVLGLQLAGNNMLQAVYQLGDTIQSNLHGRHPIYDPSRCKKHELLYPGNLPNVWMCDCAAAAIYYQETDSCYPAFLRGPCRQGEYLVLGYNNKLPVCIVNECIIDGQVKLNDRCYEFGEAGPCEDIEPSSVIGVDPQTLLVTCLKVYTIDECALGSKRAIQRRCLVRS